jgi:hypothetical protein
MHSSWIVYVAPPRGDRSLTYHPNSSWQSADMSSVLSFKSLVAKQRISVLLPSVTNTCSLNISSRLSPSHEVTALSEECFAKLKSVLCTRTKCVPTICVLWYGSTTPVSIGIRITVVFRFRASLKFTGCYAPLNLPPIAPVNVPIYDVVFARQNALRRVGVSLRSCLLLSAISIH